MEMQGLGLGLPPAVCRPSPERKIRIRSVPDAARANKVIRTQSMGCIALNRMHSLKVKVITAEDDDQPCDLDDLVLSPSKHLLRKTISMQFPMPPVESEAERSFWSPSTVADSSRENSPVFSDISDALSPVQVTAHPALHLLSPKGAPLANATAFDAYTNAELVNEALEFGWMIPFVQDGVARRSIDNSPLTSPTSTSSSLEAPSMTSGFSCDSAASVSTAATSLQSPSSIMDRKRPIYKVTSAYFGGAKASETERKVSSATIRHSKSLSLLALVDETIKPTVSSDNLKAPQAASMRRSTSRVPLSVQPRQELLDLWAKAEKTERNSPVLLETAASPKRRVREWLGKLQKTKSASPILTTPIENIKEPRVKRTRSIEQLVC